MTLIWDLPKEVPETDHLEGGGLDPTRHGVPVYHDTQRMIHELVVISRISLLRSCIVHCCIVLPYGSTTALQ